LIILHFTLFHSLFGNVTIFVDIWFQTYNQHIFVNSAVNMGTMKKCFRKKFNPLITQIFC
jgi:hypothetical protein